MDASKLTDLFGWTVISSTVQVHAQRMASILRMFGAAKEKKINVFTNTYNVIIDESSTTFHKFSKFRYEIGIVKLKLVLTEALLKNDRGPLDVTHYIDDKIIFSVTKSKIDVKDNETAEGTALIELIALPSEFNALKARQH